MEHCSLLARSGAWVQRALLAVAAILVASSAAAQEGAGAATQGAASERTGVPRQFGVWVATAGGVPMKSPEPLEHGTLISLGAGIAWTVQQTSLLSLRYRVDVMPLMIFSNVATVVGQNCTPVGSRCSSRILERGDVAALGFTPLGLELGTPHHAPVGLAITGTGGFMLSRRPIPYPTTSRFNFVASAGLSAHARLTSRLALTGEVHRTHMSNGKLKTDNPGLDYTTWRIGLRY